MPTPTTKTLRAPHPIAVAAACGLAVAATVTALANLAAAEPHVGDMIVFRPAAIRSNHPGPRLMVHRQDAFGCTLEMGVLRDFGGSLVVESRIDSGANWFRVHWAGDRTSADAANCGHQADLIVNRNDLAMLASTAGG